MSYDLIKPSDPQYFTQTSDDPYDRHKYKVISKTGDEVTVDDWESKPTHLVEQQVLSITHRSHMSCPYCGRDDTPCAEVNSLASAWARQACKYKYEKSRKEE